MNCLAPWLTGWLISQKEEKKYNSTLCAMGIMLQMPRTLTKKTLGYRAFLTAASKLWNGLPPQIQNEPNFNRFKGLLKTQITLMPTRARVYALRDAHAERMCANNGGNFNCSPPPPSSLVAC